MERSNQPAVGKHTLTERLRDDEIGPPRPPSTRPPGAMQGGMQAAAARGTATATARLPFGDLLQRAFGPHDLSSIRAHVGGDAARAARAMGAQAYAHGEHVVLPDGADLHTVAHEVAHVVQQRAGIHVADGVGAAGDGYERAADTAADRVVAGLPVADLFGPPAPGGAPAVQHKPIKGNNTSAGQEYRDDRGGPVLIASPTHEHWYGMNNVWLCHYPQTDQYSDSLHTYWWDPERENWLQWNVERGCYLERETPYDYDGQHYVQRKPVEKTLDVDSVEVTAASEDELRKWGISDLRTALVIIKGEVMSSKFQSALSLLKGWNASFSQFVPKETTTSKSKKRKAEDGPRAVTLEECGLGSEQLASLQKEREVDESTKKQKTALETLEVSGKKYELAARSTGGYYSVYDIVDKEPILPSVSNSELVLRIPKGGPDKQMAAKGQLDYRKISEARVSLPKVFNKPRDDGYFVVEKIAHGCDPKPWRTAGAFSALGRVDQQRVLSIREVLVHNAKSGRQVVPDFRPSNLRFRSEEDPTVVLVDFTDDAGLMAEKPEEEFARDLKHFLTEFCGGSDNWLWKFLTTGMPLRLVSLIEKVELF